MVSQEVRERIRKLIEEDIRIYRRAKEVIEELSTCKSCTFCCHNNTIIVTIPELIRICKYTGKSPKAIVENPESIFGLKIIKVEVKGFRFRKHRCLFLRGNKCSIYPVRPFQCMTYPLIFFHNYYELNTFMDRKDEIIYFRCHNPKSEGIVCSILENLYHEIWEERYAFLVENYRLGSELTKERSLLKAILEEVDDYDIEKFIGNSE